MIHTLVIGGCVASAMLVGICYDHFSSDNSERLHNDISSGVSQHQINSDTVKTPVFRKVNYDRSDILDIFELLKSKTNNLITNPKEIQLNFAQVMNIMENDLVFKNKYNDFFTNFPKHYIDFVKFITGYCIEKINEAISSKFVRTSNATDIMEAITNIDNSKNDVQSIIADVWSIRATNDVGKISDCFYMWYNDCNNVCAHIAGLITVFLATKSPELIRLAQYIHAILNSAEIYLLGDFNKAFGLDMTKITDIELGVTSMIIEGVLYDFGQTREKVYNVLRSLTQLSSSADNVDNIEYLRGHLNEVLGLNMPLIIYVSLSSKFGTKFFTDDAIQEFENSYNDTKTDIANMIDKIKIDKGLLTSKLTKNDVDNIKKILDDLMHYKCVLDGTPEQNPRIGTFNSIITLYQ